MIGDDNLRDGPRQIESGMASVHVCWMKVDSESAVDIDGLPLTNPSQIARMVPKRRNQHIAGRLCLIDLLRRQGLNPSAGELNLTSDGLRFCDGESDIAVSIAHSESLAVAALFVGGKRIGIDCEPQFRDLSEGALQEFCTPEEVQSLLSADPSVRLYHWMVKEAVGKAIGEGMAASRRIHVTSTEATLDGIRYSVQSIPETILNHRFVIAILHSDS